MFFQNSMSSNDLFLPDINSLSATNEICDCTGAPEVIISSQEAEEVGLACMILVLC